MLNYEVKRFPVEWVQDKIHLRSGRPELGRPVRRFFSNKTIKPCIKNKIFAEIGI